MTAFQRFGSLLTPFVVAFALAALPAIAQAQPKNSANFTPQITSFEIDQADQLVPGAEIDFIVEGTPRSQASVRLSGINKTIALREVESGLYEGTYTISRRDKLSPTATARATLRSKKGATVASRALAATAAAPAAVAVAVAPKIERFTVTPVARIEPGAELRFTALGTAGARATFSIDGIAEDIPMREVRPGQYEGAYTIRRNDNFPPSLNIMGVLVANGQTVRAKLNQALLVDARPPTVKNLAPRNNENVPGNPVSVSATFDDSGGVGVDPKTVKLLIDGQDVSRSASITPQFVTWRGELRSGTHQVELSASDNAGNSVRQNWSFAVGAPTGQAPLAVLPLDITSHANNAQVSSGAVEVVGRTAPDAQLEVQVQSIASMAGFFGINQQVLNTTVRADPNGNFRFNFQTQIPIPGARYEVTVVATKGEQRRETKLVLFQQR